MSSNDSEEIKFIKCIISVLWAGFSLTFLVITLLILKIVLSDLWYNQTINLNYIGYIVLCFELVLAGLKAITEGGHFPLRYLITFLISAIIFYVAVNKSTINAVMFTLYIGSIIGLSLFYIYVKQVSKKNRLEE